MFWFCRLVSNANALNENKKNKYVNKNNVVYSYDFMIFSRNVKNIDEEVDIFAESLFFK